MPDGCNNKDAPPAPDDLEMAPGIAILTADALGLHHTQAALAGALRRLDAGASDAEAWLRPFTPAPPPPPARRSARTTAAGDGRRS
jgi:hypothetical protein